MHVLITRVVIGQTYTVLLCDQAITLGNTMYQPTHCAYVSLIAGTCRVVAGNGRLNSSPRTFERLVKSNVIFCFSERCLLHLCRYVEHTMIQLRRKRALLSSNSSHYILFCHKNQLRWNWFMGHFYMHAVHSNI